ncbi:MAG: Crp/Fnr family transcriptional regulator [Rhodospirillales bacterium]
MSDAAERSLAGIKLFAEVTPAERAGLEQHAVFRRYMAGEQIIDRQSDSRDMFCVVRGTVRVVVYSASGREVSLDDIDAGGYFGELACLDSRPRSASVVALTNTVVAAISPAVLERVLLEHPKIALTLMRRLARMIRQATDRIVDLTTLGANNRVYAELLRLAKPSPKDTGKTSFIRPVPIHGDIASRVSTTRETVARVLSDLAKRQLVVKEGASLIIKDIKRLRDMVEHFRID